MWGIGNFILRVIAYAQNMLLYTLTDSTFLKLGKCFPWSDITVYYI